MGALLKSLLRQDRLIRVFALGQLCNPKLVELVAWSGGLYEPPARFRDW